MCFFLSDKEIFETQNEYLEGLREMIEYAVENKEDIYEQRRLNGIEGKY